MEIACLTINSMMIARLVFDAQQLDGEAKLLGLGAPHLRRSHSNQKVVNHHAGASVKHLKSKELRQRARHRLDGVFIFTFTFIPSEVRPSREELPGCQTCLAQCATPCESGRQSSTRTLDCRKPCSRGFDLQETATTLIYA